MCAGRSKVLEYSTLKLGVSASMIQKKTKLILGACCIAFLALGCFAYFTFPRTLFGGMILQMRAGKSYMDSLTEADYPQWIERSNTLLSQWQPTTTVTWLYGAEIPEDLRALKIQRIDILKDSVRYVWVGGLDHTCLSVRQMPNGTYKISAQYDDEHGRVLWPQ